MRIIMRVIKAHNKKDFNNLLMQTKEVFMNLNFKSYLVVKSFYNSSIGYGCNNIIFNNKC